MKGAVALLGFGEAVDVDLEAIESAKAGPEADDLDPHGGWGRAFQAEASAGRVPWQRH